MSPGGSAERPLLQEAGSGPRTKAAVPPVSRLPRVTAPSPLSPSCLTPSRVRGQGAPLHPLRTPTLGGRLQPHSSDGQNRGEIFWPSSKPRGGHPTGWEGQAVGVLTPAPTHAHVSASAPGEEQDGGLRSRHALALSRRGHFPTAASGWVCGPVVGQSPAQPGLAPSGTSSGSLRCEGGRQPQKLGRAGPQGVSVPQSPATQEQPLYLEGLPAPVHRSPAAAVRLLCPRGQLHPHLRGPGQVSPRRGRAGRARRGCELSPRFRRALRTERGGPQADVMQSGVEK